MTPTTDTAAAPPVAAQPAGAPPAASQPRAAQPAERGTAPGQAAEGRYRISAIGPSDAPAVVRFMRRYPEVHFCDWEDEALLARAVRQQQPAASFFCRDAGGEILGAVIAGSLGVRGTISHVAVAPWVRRQGIASALVRRSLAAFRDGGIHRVFLFVVDEAGAARRFWRAHGFCETRGEATLEADL